MPLLRTSLLLALGLCLNTTMASESLENSTAIYSQGKQPLEAKKRDSRQRTKAECGISPNVWALNICESNTFCYTAQEALFLCLSE
jgi:hypothetical protein